MVSVPVRAVGGCYARDVGVTTPAEHAASHHPDCPYPGPVADCPNCHGTTTEPLADTVRGALADCQDVLSAPDIDRAMFALNRLVALAERATELERDPTENERRAREMLRERMAQLQSALDSERARAEQLERERDFHEESYKQEHRTRHAMEDTIADLRSTLATVNALDEQHLGDQYPAEVRRYIARAALDGGQP